MSRPKGNSPRLDIEITDEQLEKAVRSNSGGCLIPAPSNSSTQHHHQGGR